VVRIVAVVEGATEQAFIERVVAPHLVSHGIGISARRIGEPGHKGGNINFDRLMNDVNLLLKQEHSTHVTTLIDRYGLGSGWPDRQTLNQIRDPNVALSLVCGVMSKEIVSRTDESIRKDRFHPYVQFYETEAFLFVEPRLTAEMLGQKDKWTLIASCLTEFDTPEHINDNANQAPSKRIQQIFENYQKGRGLNAHLPNVCEKIGIAEVRKACPLFDGWIHNLESLPSL